jgi:flagellar basal body-associated protein FliL|tara:strand:+ start:60 stop:236 length:177 start_codon:yes stop_codon:yes gene_type:complete
MSLDPVVTDKIKKKLSDENQSEDLTNQILEFLEKKDLNQINTEEKIKLIENILEKIKI